MKPPCATQVPFSTKSLTLWLVTTFLCWCLILAVAIRRVAVVERALGSNGATVMTSDAANLRNLYGFSLLDDERGDAHADDAQAAAPNPFV